MRPATGLRTAALALAAVSMAALGGCKYEGDDMAAEGATEETTQSLAAMLADRGNVGDVARAMRDTGLMQVFDGAAYYTLLAPTDEAFAPLIAPGDAEDEETRNAALAAVLRDHILPGYLTTEDIAQAIADSGEDSVRIQSMGDHALTFAMEGEDVRVSSEDGASAMLLSGEGRASNGVVIPVDGVLKEL